MSEPCLYRVEANFDAVSPSWGGPVPDPQDVALAMARALGAMPLGHLEEGTAVSLAGTGGSTARSEPESESALADAPRCVVVVEVQSARRERAEEVVGEVIDALHEAANSPDSTCDLQVRIESHAAADRRLEPLAQRAGAGSVKV